MQWNDFKWIIEIKICYEHKFIGEMKHYKHLRDRDMNPDLADQSLLVLRGVWQNIGIYQTFVNNKNC